MARDIEIIDGDYRVRLTTRKTMATIGALANVLARESAPGAEMEVA